MSVKIIQPTRAACIEKAAAKVVASYRKFMEGYPLIRALRDALALPKEKNIVVGYVIRWRESQRWLREVFTDDTDEWTGARWAEDSCTSKPARWTAADVERARRFWTLGYGGKFPFSVHKVTRRTTTKKKRSVS